MVVGRMCGGGWASGGRRVSGGLDVGRRGPEELRVGEVLVVVGREGLRGLVEPLHGYAHRLLDLHGPVLLVGGDGQMEAGETLADLVHLEPEGELAIVVRRREADGVVVGVGLDFGDVVGRGRRRVGAVDRQTGVVEVGQDGQYEWGWGLVGLGGWRSGSGMAG